MYVLIAFARQVIENILESKANGINKISVTILRAKSRTSTRTIPQTSMSVTQPFYSIVVNIKYKNRKNEKSTSYVTQNTHSNGSPREKHRLKDRNQIIQMIHIGML
jgi:hypothetical protein